MPTIKEQLRADLTVAMKTRDQTRTRTLRIALTSISNEEVSGAAAHDLTDDQVLKILAREAKRRREAASYLPAQLADDELAAMVAEAIAETGVSGPAGLGHVMKVLTPRVAGRADGSRVAALVRAKLSG